jgi:hypothetical protein
MRARFFRLFLESEIRSGAQFCAQLCEGKPWARRGRWPDCRIKPAEPHKYCIRQTVTHGRSDQNAGRNDAQEIDLEPAQRCT